MNDSPDPLGRWAPYARWAVTVAMILVATLWPQVKLPPLPSPESVADIRADVKEIKQQNAAVMRVFAVPPKN